jgi:hypothetical protein
MQLHSSLTLLERTATWRLRDPYKYTQHFTATLLGALRNKQNIVILRTMLIHLNHSTAADATMLLCVLY